MDPTPARLCIDLAYRSPADRRQRWTAFAISSVLQPVGLALTVWFVGGRGREFQPRHKELQYVHLTLPAAPGKPAPPPMRVLPPPKPRLPRVVPPLPRLEITPPVEANVTEPPEPPKALLNEAPLSPAIPPVPAAIEVPKRRMPAVRTDVFSNGPPALGRNRPAREVQTGGFGSVNGLPGEAQGGSHGNVAKLGSFDLPSGPSYGNGFGGSEGGRGKVLSVGFGNGIAGPGAGQSPSRGGVRESGFRSENAAAQAAGARPRITEAPPLQPVEILSKPTPTYTEEARRLRLEGEVLVDVVFAASGQVRVLGVVKGLGHGLDDAALRAAERIRFTPARRDGQPVDSKATLHIVFQLAY